MQALILAAGLGTRLRPLTDDRPKALVEINGKTLLQINVQRLADAGATLCVVNVHHFGDMLIDYIRSHQWPCRMLVSDERQLLLDTGGALRHAAPLFDPNSPVLVHNVDILSQIDLRALQKHHLDSGNLVTLCTSHRQSSRMLLFDHSGNLAGIYRPTDNNTNQTLNSQLSTLTPLPFSGISMVSPELFPLLPPDDHPYPSLDCYLQLAKHHRIGYFIHSPQGWFDVGTPEKLEKARVSEL